MQLHFSNPVWRAGALCLLLLAACNKADKSTKTSKTPETAASGLAMFKKLDPAKTGISFQNGVRDDNGLNVINFSYLYISGAVGVGDFNKDGLEDLYLASTQGSNKLYLNKGNLQFEDITASAGVAAGIGLKTGVTIADINGDTYLDIYVCRTGVAGQPRADRTNLLYINNQNNTFTESAKAYGLDDQCSSNHANFFDYDLDGDLDLYLLNHPEDFESVNKMRVTDMGGGKLIRNIKPDNPYESDRLYRNNGNNTFTNVSELAGIVNRAFGLSCTVSDVNNDGYPDIYIGNDYVEPDILYINNKNGTFTDHLNDYFKHITYFTMGTDFADMNNDGMQDFLAMDMLPDGHERQKSLATVMVADRYNSMVKYGYGHQIMRNLLQLNTGKGFSDIGVMAGISATEWTWGPIAMDFDNDGWRDLFMANGNMRDFTNNDYIHFTLDSVMKTGLKSNNINDLISSIPSVKTRNYMFRNRGNTSFEDVSEWWGFGDKTFSNGSAYADLDNDGDLELIVNNQLDPAGIYENQSRSLTKNNYLQLIFEGGSPNTYGVGAAARISSSDYGVLYQDLSPTRGFLSSQQHLIHFGLGTQAVVPQVEIRWPDGKVQTLSNVPANQRITVKYADAQKGQWAALPVGKPVFSEVPAASIGLNFKHTENEFLDYNRDLLIPHNLSTQGPCVAVADINGDQLDDLFIGGATGQAAALYIQDAEGRFKSASADIWEKDKDYEDTDCVFFDADGDKDLDLWVSSGGNAHPTGSPMYQNRLYLNDGKGQFSKSPEAMPKSANSSACVALFDYDKDGDSDVFVGGRVVTESYPIAPESYVFQNNGGKFSDVTQKLAPAFRQCGMVSSIQFADLDNNGAAEMIVAGEFMPLAVYQFANGVFEDKTTAFGLDNSNGWWNCILAEDMDKDGDLDLVSGNLGENTRLRASADVPLHIFAKDFDQNGKLDPIIAMYENGIAYPLAQRDLLIKQMPSLKKKFLRYNNYAKATIDDVISEKDQKAAKIFYAYTFKSTYFENQGNGRFKAVPLPMEAQAAPVSDIKSGDFNGDGLKDLLMVGNDYSNEVETSRCDAFNGLLLYGDGKGGFRIARNIDHGFWANKEARQLVPVRTAKGAVLWVVANNNEQVQVFRQIQ